MTIVWQDEFRALIMLMIMFMFKLFPLVSVAIATSVAILTDIAHPAQAAPVTYDFTVNVTKGSLAGKSFTGTFSYDDASLKGTGVEALGVAQGLTVCMNFFGRNYTAKNDSDYPTFPKLVLENGQIKELDFWIEPGKRLRWWNLPGWSVKTSRRQGNAASVAACESPSK